MHTIWRESKLTSNQCRLVRTAAIQRNIRWTPQQHIHTIMQLYSYQCLFTNNMVVPGRRPLFLVGKIRHCSLIRTRQTYAIRSELECVSSKGRDLEMAKSRVRSFGCVRRFRGPAVLVRRYVQHSYLGVGWYPYFLLQQYLMRC